MTQMDDGSRQVPKGGSRVVQQTLPTYFPHAKPKCMLPAFFILGIIFLTLGSIILRSNDSVVNLFFRYDNQNNYQYMPDPRSGTTSTQHGLRTFRVNGTDHKQGSKARVMFTLRKPLEPPIYLYYGMSDYYQNYLDYHDGRSSLQLAGKSIESSLSYKCLPFLNPGMLDDRSGTLIDVQGQQVPIGGFTYYPCGVTAWSMFNDTFVLYKVMEPETFTLPASRTAAFNLSKVQLLCNGSDFTTTGEPLSGRANSCAKKGISWDADINTRFKPIAQSDRGWAQRYTLATSDPYLANGWYAFEPGHSLPDPMDLDFHVWMRIAPTPAFRKLYRILNVPMAAGTYLMDIDEFYDTSSLGSEKFFQLRVESWLGMPNTAIGIAYIAAGSLGVVLGVAFAVQQLARQCYKSSFETHELRPYYQFSPDSEEMKAYVALRRSRLEEERANT